MRHLTVLAATVVAACGGSSSTSADGGSVEGISLAVNSTMMVADVAGTDPKSGDQFYAVRLTLDNRSMVAAPLYVAEFSLVMVTGLEYVGSTATLMYAGGCDSTASVAPGGATTCTIVFEVPIGMPKAVDYMLPDGKVVHAAVSGSGGDAGIDAGSDYIGLGETCTGAGQGSCPTGFICWADAASMSYCTKSCTPGAGDDCRTGYGGPGYGYCGTQLSHGDYVCAVACQDNTDDREYCPTGCNGQCPGSTTCSGLLNGGAGEFCE